MGCPVRQAGLPGHPAGAHEGRGGPVYRHDDQSRRHHCLHCRVVGGDPGRRQTEAHSASSDPLPGDGVDCLYRFRLAEPAPARAGVQGPLRQQALREAAGEAVLQERQAIRPERRRLDGLERHCGDRLREADTPDFAVRARALPSCQHAHGRSHPDLLRHPAHSSGHLCGLERRDCGNGGGDCPLRLHCAGRCKGRSAGTLPGYAYAS
mmetsp:Transcript_44030/g.127334  ORF Transcript_44030/g.127334 Transcript_44030/m.127334 type:complete len:208 (-) Transcript_44030:165-788(-)